MTRIVFGVLLICFLVSCAASATSRKCQPACPKDVQPAVAKNLQQGGRNIGKDPLSALSTLMLAARHLEQDLSSGSSSRSALSAYNYAMARVVEAVEKGKVDIWSTPQKISTTEGDIWLKARLGSNLRGLHPETFHFIPADTVKIGGAYFQTVAREEGIGAPMAVISKHQHHVIKHDLNQSLVYGAVTATLDFHGNRAELIIHESLGTDSVTLDGRSYPLAKDFSTPLALLLVHHKIEKLGLSRLLSPDRYAETAKITRLQIYDPKRIPVLMVHGLDSTPGTWIPMINGLRADPEIRKRYQFWVFSYPSGYPYPYSASLLRKEMDLMAIRYPGHKPIVLVGHSMGGIISRLMLTDTGDFIWKSYFGKRPEETVIPGEYRSELEKAWIFKHRHDVGRTIFISAPHRGSEIATSQIGRIASRLVRTPRLLKDIRDTLISVVTVDAAALMLQRAPSSIDTLAPNNRFVKLINNLPLTKSIPYHSIIGDRGRGDTPNSSDGVVAYWSSHLNGAVSEQIVPSGHSAHQHPEGIEEVHRILQKHAF